MYGCTILNKLQRLYNMTRDQDFCPAMAVSGQVLLSCPAKYWNWLGWISTQLTESYAVNIIRQYHHSAYRLYPVKICSVWEKFYFLLQCLRKILFFHAKCQNYSGNCTMMLVWSIWLKIINEKKESKSFTKNRSKSFMSNKHHEPEFCQI